MPRRLPTSAERIANIEKRWTDAQAALAAALRNEGADCFAVALMGEGAGMGVNVSPEAAERIVKRFVDNLMSEPFGTGGE